VGEGEKTRDEPNRHTNPALPEPDGASGDKQQSTDHNHPNKEPKKVGLGFDLGYMGPQFSSKNVRWKRVPRVRHKLNAVINFG